MRLLERLREQSAAIRDRVVNYGIRFLDDAMRGIGPGELVILGAATGVGKTDALATIAGNVAQHDRVVFYALEAHNLEIEKRILYRMVSDVYFAMPPGVRPRLSTGFLNYPDYHRGMYGAELRAIEDRVEPAFEKAIKNIKFIYSSEVGAQDLMLEIEAQLSDGVALFCVDHLHHLEHGDDDELKGLKSTMKLCERIVNDQEASILFASHLRKADRFRPEFPDVHDLHGSSEISKRATGVILMGPHRGGGFGAEKHEVSTLMHCAKFRLEGGVKQFYGLHKFNTHTRSYSSDYMLMRRGADDRGRQVFDAVARRDEKPAWARFGKTLDMVNG